MSGELQAFVLVFVYLVSFVVVWFFLFVYRRPYGRSPRAMGRPSVRQLIVWSGEFETSAAQLQKAFDWRVTQWSNIGNAIAAATFGFVATAIVEFFKRTLKVPHFGIIVALGAVVSAGLYAFCRYQIHQLRSQFLDIYTVLIRLH